jgi:hypothetical protein
MSVLAENRLQGIAMTTAHGAVQLSGSGDSNAVYRLERSSDLQIWQGWFRIIPGNGSFRVLDHTFPAVVSRFYRFSTISQTAADDWKNQAIFPTDPVLASTEAGQVRWRKFLILVNDPTRVYFQDSAKYVLHCEFAEARLPQFSQLSRTEFDAISLYANNQRAILAAMLLAPRTKALGVRHAVRGPGSLCAGVGSQVFRTGRGSGGSSRQNEGLLVSGVRAEASCSDGWPHLSRPAATSRCRSHRNDPAPAMEATSGSFLTKRCRRSLLASWDHGS